MLHDAKLASNSTIAQKKHQQLDEVYNVQVANLEVQIVGSGLLLNNLEPASQFC